MVGNNDEVYDKKPQRYAKDNVTQWMPLASEELRSRSSAMWFEDAAIFHDKFFTLW